MAQGTRELIEQLGQIDPSQPYGTELFNALARLTISVAVEAVWLGVKRVEYERMAWGAEHDVVEVYMTQRSKEECDSGQWHCPGSVLRPGESFEDVFSRLAEREFQAPLLSAKFVANLNPAKPTGTEDRGTFLSIVYLCEFEYPKEWKGTWFPVNNLPKETHYAHRTRIIPCALGQFLADNPGLRLL